MKYLGISNRWSLLEQAVSIPDIKDKFSAYGWYQDNDIKISKNESYCGWHNEVFNFVSIWALSPLGRAKLVNAQNVFGANGYIFSTLIQGGIGIEYRFMSNDEVHKRLEQNFRNGGRMSD